MSKIEKFEDLNVWKESRVLANTIYSIILSNPNVKDYPLKDQINRSSGSIMDNIAEGFDRQGNKGFIKYLNSSDHKGTKYIGEYEFEYLTKNRANLNL